MPTKKPAAKAKSRPKAKPSVASSAPKASVMSPMSALQMIFVDKSPVKLPKNVKQWVVNFLALFDVLFLVVTLFDVLRVLGINTLSSQSTLVSPKVVRVSQWQY